jgi:hypothetical protein
VRVLNTSKCPLLLFFWVGKEEFVMAKKHISGIAPCMYSPHCPLYSIKTLQERLYLSQFHIVGHEVPESYMCPRSQSWFAAEEVESKPGIETARAMNAPLFGSSLSNK